MMETLMRIFEYAFPNVWPFKAYKRARFSEENEENIDLASSPPKRLKRFHSFSSKSLNEENSSTVGPSRKRPLTEKIDGSNEIPMAREASSPQTRKPKRNSRGSLHTSMSIDLTVEDPCENQPSRVPCIDITGDDNEESNSILIRINGSSSRSRSGPSLIRRGPGFARTNRRTSSESFPRSRNLTKIDLTIPSSSRRRQQSHFSPINFQSQSIDLYGRYEFGRLLGSYASHNRSTGSEAPASLKPTEIIDLSKDSDDDDPIIVKTISKATSLEDSKNLSLPKKSESAQESSSISSSASRGVKHELMRVNSFEKKVKEKKVSNKEWLSNLLKDYEKVVKQFDSTKERLELEAKLWEEETKKVIEARLEEQLSKHLKITEAFLPEVTPDEFAPIIRPFPELTKEMLDRVKKTTTRMPRDFVFIEMFKYKITMADIITLHNTNWLNDEIINFYVQLIQERNNSMENYPRVKSFSTFFYEAIKKRGYDGVKRWTKKENVFDNDIIIIPIHLGIHWCLLTIDLKKKEINYYDSMGQDNNDCLKAMSDYLVKEHKAKQGSELDLSDWKIQNVKGIPQQMNGSDCGVFLCTFAEYCSRRAPFEFSQSNMTYFRQKMVYEILTGKLL